MGAILNFDARSVAPSTGAMDAIPAGWYNAMIDESGLKPTKDGQGNYLELRLNVIDGQYAGRKLFTRLNLRNANPVAQEIAYKDLSAICHATGVIQVQDSGQLHGIPMKVKVKLRKATDEYEASNEVSAYKNINEVVEGAGGSSAPAGFPAPAGFQAPQAMQAPQGFGAPQAAPVAPAPQYQQPQAAPAAAAPQGWAPPAAAQPWGGAAPAAAPQQPAPQQFQPPAPQAAPAWAGAPSPAAAPQQFQTPAPQAPQGQPAGFPGAVPPWMGQPGQPS